MINNTNPLFERTQLLFGSDGMEKLYKSKVAVFGIGGVGGHTAEALARSGIGSIDLIDADTVALSNINRQIIATTDVIGQYKADVMKNRISLINPSCKVNAYNLFYNQQNMDKFNFNDYDFIIDAIDTITSKLLIIENAVNCNTQVISCMGAGNKTDPTKFEVTDIYKTTVCPLAKVIRHELRKRNIKSLKVVYSVEIPIQTGIFNEETNKQIPASNAFVPSVAGLIMAGEVIKTLVKTGD